MGVGTGVSESTRRVWVYVRGVVCECMRVIL